MRPAADFVLGYFLQRARELSGVRLQPAETTFVHAPPADIRPYARFFGGQLTWRQPGSMVLSRAQQVCPSWGPIPSWPP
ncbi:MAG: AraC family transcriptional regulator ligand-binding domain-containing protein [bacterium]